MFDTRDLAGFQREFLTAITTAERSDRAGLEVYRDTIFYGLLDVLRLHFEATAQALGEDAFKAFGRDYIHAHPMSGGNRSAYGDAFADFLRHHPQTAAWPWLGDLAAFEQALDHAHHAADAEGCDFEDLMAPDGRFTLHPSVQRLHLTHDVRRFYAATMAQTVPETPVPISHDLLIGRNAGDEVIMIDLAPYEVAFLDGIAATGSLFRTLESLAPDDNDMTILQSLLARLVQNNLIIFI